MVLVWIWGFKYVGFKQIKITNQINRNKKRQGSSACKDKYKD